LTARDPATLRDLATVYPDMALPLALDVTKQAGIERRRSRDVIARVAVPSTWPGQQGGFMVTTRRIERRRTMLASCAPMFETNFFWAGSRMYAGALCRPMRTPAGADFIM
jgi:hypothetical protein